MVAVHGLSPVGPPHRFVAVPVPGTAFPLLSLPPPVATTGAGLPGITAARFAEGITVHRQQKMPDGPVLDLTAPALALFTASADVHRWAVASTARWPGFCPHVGPEIEVRDRLHDSSPRGIVHATPREVLYEELHTALPGSSIVTAASRPRYALTGRGPKLFPGRGSVYRFADATYAVHVFGGTDGAMIRISESDPRTGHCRHVDWPVLREELSRGSRRERCLAGIRQATELIAARRGIAPEAVTATIDRSATTGIAYARDADGKAMAFFECADGSLTCTNGTILCDAHPDGRIPVVSWDEAIRWIEREIFSGRVLVERATDMTALSVPTAGGPMAFAAGLDNYAVTEVAPFGPIALSQWSAITQVVAALEATGARGGTQEIPTALQAHVELPFQQADGTFTAAPLVAVLRQWRDELPLLAALIPAEPGRYVFIPDLDAAVFDALGAVNLDDTSPLGVATIYGNLLAAFYAHHGAKYAALNITPLCGHVLQQMGKKDPEVRAWLDEAHPLLNGQSLAEIVPTLKGQPTIEIRRSDTLVNAAGGFSAFLNEAMLWFLFGWTLRAIARAGNGVIRE